MNPQVCAHPRPGLFIRATILLLACVLCAQVYGCAGENGVSGGEGGEQAARLTGLHPTQDLSMYKPAASGKVIKMELNFAMQHQDQFDELMHETQDPKSKQYQHWLTPEQMHAHFGETQGQFDAVEQWLTSQGFTITEKGYGTNEDFIRFKGTIGQAEKAFKMEIVSPEYGHFANKQDPAIPPQFVGVISTITGLSGEAY